jgi:hypothetical protein
LTAAIERFSFIGPTAKPQYTLPEALFAQADIATNGEFFFPRDCAADAARALADQGRAITGGETYCRRAVGWAAYLGEWTTPPPTGSEESWDDRVARSLAEAIRMIDRPFAEWGDPSALPQDLRFFLASLAR